MNIYGIGLIGQRSKFNKKIQQLESTPSIIEIFQLFNYFTGRATTERWSWVEEQVRSLETRGAAFRSSPPAASKFARALSGSAGCRRNLYYKYAVYPVNAKCIPSLS